MSKPKIRYVRCTTSTQGSKYKFRCRQKSKWTGWGNTPAMAYAHFLVNNSVNQMTRAEAELS